MTTHTRVQEIAVPAALRTLPDAFAPGEYVLSIYLETGPQRMDGPAYLLAYRDGCKALRAALPPDEQAAFAAAATQAEYYLTDAYSPGSPGLALFAARNGILLRRLVAGRPRR